MRVSVFGLGYVGAVTSGCFSSFGHSVVGVDPAEAKVALINQGKAPVIEKGLGETISDAVAKGRLRATRDARDAVLATDLSLICVGTPSKRNGDLDTSALKLVCAEIGSALVDKQSRHSVIVRSTVLPGTIRNVIIPELEKASGKKAGVDFGVGSNPEFLREGTALEDFFAPPKTVIGVEDDRTASELEALYGAIKAPLIRTSIEVAEMIKYSDNVWHAVKVAFANEIGVFCKSLSIDSHEVMDVFCKDTKLNLSSYYLKPGFSFGGSCLPKDVRALVHKARSLDLDLPLLGSVLPSNERQTSRGFEMIAQLGKRPVSILGMSFKAGTDDLRESPVLEIVERLIGKGYDVRIFDRNISLSKLVGANKDFLLRMIPHVSSLLVESLDDALSHGEIIVVGNGDAEFRTIGDRVRPDQFVVDLVRIKDHSRLKGNYNGISW
ncbi:GDP-mannose dehydrogenase [Bradyrhizobium centrolobii]|uniref:UDP-glucose 6-dehydrogenase n=1 Tax=Bradyrhizobium centrolobii TaxID=1505087 RepID=A0A176Z2V4_9BRAD|nr:nucleotide sugar dehydrogenase [Bradyrhizobium centrolobii]OAF13575.1 GDP-mannose dehydrogenase [Bradyrhizobium centrolobii]